MHRIPPSANVLILGGGTGGIAHDLLNRNPGVHITYIEASRKMLEISQQKLARYENVRFICGTQQSIPDEFFDVVIIGFFLDLFDGPHVQEIIFKIRNSLAENGTCQVTDFVESKWWHKVMMALMYRFFRLTSNVQARKLQNWNAQIVTCGFELIAIKKFYGDFITACVYRKAQ